MQLKRLMSCCFFVLMLAAVSQAQGGSVKCESNDGGRKYCGNYNGSQIMIDRQISGSPCTQGQTWGVDSRGLWVDRGCRAYFTHRRRPGDGRPGRGNVWWGSRSQRYLASTR